MTNATLRVRHETCIGRAQTSDVFRTAAHARTTLTYFYLKKHAMSLFLCWKELPKHARCGKKHALKHVSCMDPNHFLLFFREENGGQPCSFSPTSTRWFSCTSERTGAGGRFLLRNHRYSKKRVGREQGKWPLQGHWGHIAGPERGGSTLRARQFTICTVQCFSPTARHG